MICKSLILVAVFVEVLSSPQRPVPQGGGGGQTGGPGGGPTGSGSSTSGAATRASESQSTTTTPSSDTTTESSTGLPSGINLVDIPAGTFTMGFDTTEASNRMPAHEVTLSAFQMSDTAVTTAQYVEFLNAAMSQGLITVALDGEDYFVYGTTGLASGKKFIELSGTRVLKDHTGDGIVDPENPLNLCWVAYDSTSNTFSVKDPQAQDWDELTKDVEVFGLTPDKADWEEVNDPSKTPSKEDVADWPVTFIQWYGAWAFADFYGVGLPTEAQWEYAAKGGDANLEYATSDGSLSESLAKYNVNGIGHLATSHAVKVKSFPANPFGMYEMFGNVWEWCLDWYQPYTSDAATDPFACMGQYGSTIDNGLEPTEDLVPFTCNGFPGGDYTCDAHIKRGSSWNYHSQTLQTTFREQDYTFRGNDHFGFRIVYPPRYAGCE